MHIKLSLKRLLVTVLLFFGLFSGCKEKEDKVYRIAILSGFDRFREIADGFKAAMTDLGYVEGKNVYYHVGSADNDPDLIFAFPTGPALSAKMATQGTDIPIVFALAGIEGNNLVKSLHRPGGNISGVRFPGPESTGKRLEILYEFMPNVKRVLITYDPGYPTIPKALEELHSVASVSGITLVREPVNNLSELDSALRSRAGVARVDLDAILIMPEVLTQTPEAWSLITRFADKHKLPIAGALCRKDNDDALFTYAPDLYETGKLAAPIADKIFKGVPAGKIMVVTPKCHLWINCRVAEELGLTVSKGLLSRAYKIIH